MLTFVYPPRPPFLPAALLCRAVASIELYLDVINLFMYLLALLSGGRGNN